MKNKNLNTKELLISTFEEILKLNKSSLGGNIFDTTISNLFQDMKGFTFVSNQEWKKYYSQYRDLTLKNIYDFTNISLPENIKDDLLIVDKPNGSQQSPDILIIHNKKCLCLEIKSSKEDKIVWNSGLPKENFIYIFGCYPKGQTTFFLGQEIISNDEKENLMALDKLLKQQSSYTKEDEWELYVRPMYNYKGKFFKDEKLRLKREQNVFKFLKSHL